MIYKKTLRWLEPFGGYNINSGDTGLCNRIFHWEIAYDLNSKNNYNYLILLEEKYWPETKLIELPCTKIIKNIDGEPYELEKLKFITVFDTDSNNVCLSKEIDNKKLLALYSSQESSLFEFDNYYSNFGYMDLKMLYNNSFDITKRPLKSIRLKHFRLESFLIKQMKNVIGIHIRRGNGVPFDDNDIKSIPNDLQDEYKLLRKTRMKQANSSYIFHNDNTYHEIIDSILKINPNQKFYISCDIGLDYIKNYKEKYGNNLIDNNFIYSTFLDYLLNSGYNKNELEYLNMVNNVADLFSLSYCDFLIMSKTSTWSIFARDYIIKTSVYVDDDLNNVILPKYKKYRLLK